MSNYRQGDVGLFAIDNIPEDVKPHKGQILAYGEITGHRHEVIEGDVKMFKGPDGKLYLSVKGEKGCKVGHGTEAHLQSFKRGEVIDAVKEDVHLPLEVEKGDYAVDLQEEYAPGGWTQVLD